MHQDISIPSDRGGKMRIKISGKSIMPKLLDIIISTTKVGRLIHTPSSHNPDEPIKEGIALPLKPIETIGQLLGSIKAELKPILLDNLPEGLQIRHLGLRMPPEYANGGKPFVDPLRDRDVGQQHELLDQVVGLDQLVELDVGGAVGLLGQLYLYLR